MYQTFRKMAKDILWRAASLAGVTHLAVYQGAVVVCLHRVAPSIMKGGLDCQPELFEALCQFFTQHFKVLPLPQLVEDLRQRRPVQGRLALTFDDGYQDNLHVAAPILKKYGLPATFFVTTDFIGSGVTPWWDKDAGIARPMLSWDDVRQLHHMGFDIGGHTRSHPNMAELQPDVLRAEVAGCRQDIIDAIGIPPVSFAYPFGKAENFTQAAKAIVKASGFTCGCALFGGIIHNVDDPYCLKRIPVSDWYLSAAHFGGDLLVAAVKERLFHGHS